MTKKTQTAALYFSVVIMAIASIFWVNGLILAWTAPTAVPPGSNVAAPLNVGSTGQSKAGGLILNTGGAATGLIVDSGNVGIGTAAPGAKLDVNGTLRVGTNVWHTSAEGQNRLHFGSSATTYFGTGGGYVFRSPTDTDLVTILTGGNVGIGTAEPATKLTISADAGGLNAVLLKLANTGAGASGSGIEFGGTYYDVTGEDYAMGNARIVGRTLNAITRTGALSFWTRFGDMLQRMVINENGDVGIGTPNPSPFRLSVAGIALANDWIKASDKKYKENIATIKSALDKIMKINGVSFDWKIGEYPDKGFAEGTHYGVIAQDIEKILPEVVTEGVDGEKAVSYTEIIPVLIEAVKEQQGIIEELETRILKLEEAR